jgi:hypothetical protein
MKVLRLVRPTVSVTATIALLAGCAGLARDGGGAGALPYVSGHDKLVSGKSWMAPGTSAQDLLYVTNGNGVVNVYNYEQHYLVGVLTDFAQPEGECSDAAGNVYIADYGAKKVFEYAHGGTSPIRTLDVSPYTPYGCAVSAKNGDLAVANYRGYYHGNIEIYHHAKGKPVVYPDRFIWGFKSVAYDDKGNLLATDGNGFSSSYYGSHFAYLPKNSVKLVNIEFCFSSYCYYILSVQGIQWDGKYWVFDNYESALFRWKIANNKSHYVDEIRLSGAYEEGIGPFWFYRTKPKARPTQVVSSSYDQNNAAVFYWNYPAGGNPTGSVTSDLDAPFGVAGSLKK